MKPQTQQTFEAPIYSIPFALIGNVLLLTLSVILLFSNETTDALLSFAYVSFLFSILSIFIFFHSLSKTTFKTTPNEKV
jgi:hypothetical protein